MKTKKHETPLKVNMTDKGLLKALLKKPKVLKKDAQRPKDGEMKHNG